MLQRLRNEEQLYLGKFIHTPTITRLQINIIKFDLIVSAGLLDDRSWELRNCIQT
jgi:hypothetical protein